jgi:hypothetical protein
MKPFFLAETAAKERTGILEHWNIEWRYWVQVFTHHSIIPLFQLSIFSFSTHPLRALRALAKRAREKQ